MTSRTGRVLWAVAGAVVLAAVLAEATRPLVGHAVTADLAAVGVDPDRLALARDYRGGLVGLQVLVRIVQVGAGVALLLPPVRRRAAGLVRVLADRRARRGRPPRRAIVAGLLGAAAWALPDLLVLPLQALAWRRSVAVGLSVQDLGGWLRDWLVVAVPSWLGVAAAIAVVVVVAERRPRDWVPAAGLLLGAAGVALIVLSPVVLEPLLLTFTPLPDGQLREDVQAMAEDALGEPLAAVLVADASRRTTASNAYVSGIGSTRRVVLYDTLLADADHAEVLAVVAHELAHRAHRDVERAALWTLATAVLGITAVALLLRGRLRDVDGTVRPAVAVPVVGLAIVATVLLTPVERWSSRRAESAADAAAITLTGDPATFVGMMVGLAERNLSDPDPAPWTVLLFYTHPPVAERIGRGLEG